MTPNHAKFWSPDDDARLFDEASIDTVATRLGRTPEAVRQRRKIVRRRAALIAMAGPRLTPPAPPRPPRAKAAVSTAQIVELRACGLSWSEIAARVKLTAPACRARWQSARIAELEAELARRDEVQRKAVFNDG